MQNAIAMKFGDHCWLKNLESMPALNGRLVVLDEWIDDRQRWRCRPYKWRHSEEFIGARPKNLSNQPIPRWGLVAKDTLDADNTALTPYNTEVRLMNKSDFADTPTQDAPAWEVVHGWMHEGLTSGKGSSSNVGVAMVSRAALHSQGLPTTAAGMALKDCIPVDMEGSNGYDSTPAVLVAKIDALCKREGQLRAIAIGGSEDKVGTVSVEETVRHMLCQKELLATQIKLAALSGEMEIVKNGAAEMRKLMKHMDFFQKSWADNGYPPLDFWEDPDSGDEAEESAEMKAWAKKKAQELMRLSKAQA